MQLMGNVNRMTLRNEVKDFALQIVLPTLKFLWAKLYILCFMWTQRCQIKWQSSFLG